MEAKSIVAAICPELAKSESAEIFLQMARENTSLSFFGSQYQYAVAYRACHLFKVTAGSGGNEALGLGQVASMSEGGMSISFATDGSSSDSNAASGLKTTKYGKMLLDLINSRPKMGVNSALFKA